MPARKVSKMERAMVLSSVSASSRAKRLASISSPLVAELYEIHAEACKGRLQKPRRSGRKAKRFIGLE